MSREFTPETERQRLQFLVRKTFLLLSFLPSHLLAPLQPPVLPARAVPGGLWAPIRPGRGVLLGSCPRSLCRGCRAPGSLWDWE